MIASNAQQKLSGMKQRGTLIREPVRLQFQWRLEQLVRSGAAHPKLAKLLEVLLGHFQEHAASADAARPSRVIIFTNLRESVHTICDALRQQEPLITAKSLPFPRLATQ